MMRGNSAATQGNSGMVRRYSGGYRVKNLAIRLPAQDFQYGALSFFVLSVVVAAGALVQLSAAPLPPPLVAAIAGAALVLAVVILLLPVWSVVVPMAALAATGLLLFPDADLSPLAIGVGAGLLLSPTLQMVEHWNKAVVLRLGRFRSVRGPGVHLLLPVAERVAQQVDTRIRATDFSAEKTLTSDTVPVHVDALTFWMIWDPKLAVLEVENFVDAVVLSAQTALRDAIGKSSLAELLSERERIGKQIQQLLDTKTNPWGITILSIEFTDIVIPQALEDAMSRRAQAERESQSRVILGGAEAEVARKYREAAQTYGGDEAALHLRAMNMVYEGLKSNNSSIMVLPSSALESMSLGGVMGAAALHKAGATAASTGAAAGADAAAGSDAAATDPIEGHSRAADAPSRGEPPVS